MANFDHWMRLNIGDYLADTMHLSTIQHGIYVLLIMHCFKRGQLPADEATLAHIAGVHLKVWRRHSPAVLALFKADSQRGFVHPRIDAEREIAKALSESRSNSGKRGARKRWGMANAINSDSKTDGNSRARARDTTAIAKANPPPGNPPVIDLRSRRQKANGGGWADKASDLAAEGSDE